MLFAYWCTIIASGPEVVYGSNQTRSSDNYDAFDDFMLHFFFPFEAFVLSYFVQRSYFTYDSVLEVSLFVLLYVPLFVVYRPYPFIVQYTLVETLLFSIGVAVAAVLFHCFLVLLSKKCLKRS